MRNDEFNELKIINEGENFNFEFGPTQDSESTSYQDNSDAIRDEVNDNPISNGSKRPKENKRKENNNNNRMGKGGSNPGGPSLASSVSTAAGAALVSVVTISTLVGINAFFNAKCEMHHVEPTSNSIAYELDLTDINQDECIIQLEKGDYIDKKPLQEGKNAGEFTDLTPLTEYVISVVDVTYNHFVLYEDKIFTMEEVPLVETFVVTFNTDGGSEVASKTVEFGNTVEEPASPSKENYTFEGWFTDSECTTPYDFSSPVESDLDLYAKWNIITFTVTFHSNGGSKVDSQEVESGGTVLDPIEPARDAYKFLGWFTDSELTNKYDFRTPVVADLDLFAKWEIKTFTITFDSNGGSAVDSQTVDYGNTVAAPSNPTKENYTFGGWFTDDTFARAYDFDMPVTRDITLIAKWDIITYTVTFHSNGGTTIDPLEVESGDSVSAPTEPTKDTYNFKGWYTDSELTQEYDFDTPVFQDLDLYAKWEIMTFNVSFVSNGGSSVDTQTIEYGGTVIEPAAPSKEDYAFMGWYADSELTQEYDFDTPVVSTFSLYAKWARVFTVRFVTGDGATEIDPQYILDGSNAEKPSDPTRENYEFDGWYTSDIYEDEFDFSNMPITADTYIYAKWNSTLVDPSLLFHVDSFASMGNGALMNYSYSYVANPNPYSSYAIVLAMPNSNDQPRFDLDISTTEGIKEDSLALDDETVSTLQMNRGYVSSYQVIGINDSTSEETVLDEGTFDFGVAQSGYNELIFIGEKDFEVNGAEFPVYRVDENYYLPVSFVMSDYKHRAFGTEFAVHYLTSGMSSDDPITYSFTYKGGTAYAPISAEHAPTAGNPTPIQKIWFTYKNGGSDEVMTSANSDGYAENVSFVYANSGSACGFEINEESLLQGTPQLKLIASQAADGSTYADLGLATADIVFEFQTGDYGTITQYGSVDLTTEASLGEYIDFTIKDLEYSTFLDYLRRYPVRISLRYGGSSIDRYENYSFPVM